MSDLFPKMKEEAVDYGKLEKAIRASCPKFGLEDVNGKLIPVLFNFSKIPYNFLNRNPEYMPVQKKSAIVSELLFIAKKRCVENVYM